MGELVVSGLLRNGQAGIRGDGREVRTLPFGGKPAKRRPGEPAAHGKASRRRHQARSFSLPAFTAELGAGYWRVGCPVRRVLPGDAGCGIARQDVVRTRSRVIGRCRCLAPWLVLRWLGAIAHMDRAGVAVDDAADDCADDYAFVF